MLRRMVTPKRSARNILYEEIYMINALHQIRNFVSKIKMLNTINSKDIFLNCTLLNYS